MRTRLSLLLVAGLVASATWPCALAGETPAVGAVVEPAHDSNMLLAVSQVPGNEGDAKVRLQIPGYQGNLRYQVLPKPLRVVVDLPGVVVSRAVDRQQIRELRSSLVNKARIAQFAAAPKSVTRAVFEVVEGTQVAVTPDATGLTLDFTKGQGKTLVAVNRAEPTQTPADHPLQALVASVVTTTPAPAVTEAPRAAESIQAPAATPIQALPATGMPYQVLPRLAVNASLPAMGTTLGGAVGQMPERPEARSRGGHTLAENEQRYTGSKITIDVKGAELSAFLTLIADHAKLNLICDPDVAGQTYTFKFVDAPWDLVLDMILKQAGLGKEINHGVLRVAKLEKLQKEEEDRKKLEEAKALAGDLQSVTRPLSFAKASEAKAIIEKVLTKRGSIIVDDRTNTLIITDLPHNLKLVDELVLQIDVPIQQVQIEARVVEASKTFSRSFGVKWPSSNSTAGVTTTSDYWGMGGKNSSSGWTWNSAYNASGGTGAAWTSATSITDATGELWVSFLRNSFSVNVILQAGESNGDIKIVSNPKVVTQNNKKAKILTGRKIPYQSTQSGSSSGAITTAFVDANLELDVTPQITNDGTILMDLKLTKSEADFSNTVNGTPTILNRELETQVLVKDGGTAILGGVYTSYLSDGGSSIPYLSKIPILGFLFRSKTKEADSGELLLFITPRVLKN
nr:type IV pilus secretin PilQ [uncultured Holophaga sp.]